MAKHLSSSPLLAFDTAITAWIKTGYSEVPDDAIGQVLENGDQEADELSNNAKRAKIKYLHQIPRVAAVKYLEKNFGMAPPSVDSLDYVAQPPTIDCAPTFRATVEKHTSRAWACKAQDLAGAVGHGIQLRYLSYLRRFLMAC